MAVTKHNISIPQRSTYVLVVAVVGGPDNLTGYTCEMQVRQVKASTSTLVDVPPERFSVDDLNRQVILELTDEDTLAYDWAGNAFYDLYIVGPTGDRWRLVEGLATLNKTVTRGV